MSGSHGSHHKGGSHIYELIDHFEEARHVSRVSIVFFFFCVKRGRNPYSHMLKERKKLAN